MTADKCERDLPSYSGTISRYDVEQSDGLREEWVDASGEGALESCGGVRVIYIAGPAPCQEGWQIHVVGDYARDIGW